MKKIIVSMALGWASLSTIAQTIDECQQGAAANYPLIKKYDLIRQSAAATLNNIDKGWLPQIAAYVQTTTQNKVVALPETMIRGLSSQGVELKGLSKQQYKIGLDINQNIYDGGRMKSSKAVAEQQAVVEMAQTDVSLYTIRQRINDLYFGLLLIAEKQQLNNDLQEVLRSSERKIASMVKAGTAASADLYTVEAELMNAKQTAEELASQRKAMTRMLSLFVGREVTNPTRPTQVTAPNLPDASNRLEMQAINAQIKLADVQKSALNAQLRPVLSAFAQGYYGYPGINIYKDMMERTPTLNGLVGLRLTWNIGALYTYKNNKARLQVMREQAENQRDIFIFNNKIEVAQQQENISKYHTLKLQDKDIIALRTKIRLAAESKLNHGIIDVNDLIKVINSENNAKLQFSIHDIELLKEIYNLKYTTND